MGDISAKGYVSDRFPAVLISYSLLTVTGFLFQLRTGLLEQGEYDISIQF
jgi:hypothetical protein